jgi:hypothetical protein
MFESIRMVFWEQLNLKCAVQTDSLVIRSLISKLSILLFSKHEINGKASQQSKK